MTIHVEDRSGKYKGIDNHEQRENYSFQIIKHLDTGIRHERHTCTKVYGPTCDTGRV